MLSSDTRLRTQRVLIAERPYGTSCSGDFGSAEPT